MPASLLAGLEDDLRAFLQHGLIVDPWLAGLDKEFFDYDVQDQLAQEAAQLDVTYWQEPLRTQTLDAYPIPVRFGRTAAHEVLVSTAAIVAHERNGRIHVTPDIGAEATDRLHRFIAERSFGAVVRVYGVVTFSENHAAVRHYGAIPEEEFIRGKRHRPWVGYALDDELLAGIASNLLALEVQEGRRVVVQTAAGEAHYQEVRRILAASGYLARRLELIYLSQFNLFEGWDRQVAAMAPGALELRRAFTAFAELRTGMRLLEAGCGMASQTFEGGLWEAVGPEGSIVGIDPSPGMLERAQTKAKQRRAKNVRFLRAHAERLPMFRDGQFDASVGMSFLHLADAPTALAELRRVTHPGGLVAMEVACQAAFDQPWLRDWFQPIFQLAGKHSDDGTPALLPGRLPAEGEVSAWFRAAGFQDVNVVPHRADWVFRDAEASVAFVVQGISFFQRELELLPWQARLDMLEELKRRGARVCAETTLEERTLRWPVEFVKGTAPPAGA
jgi:ubiquinone/menaquinone biosynthesis C-methylase UbiE